MPPFDGVSSSRMHNMFPVLPLYRMHDGTLPYFGPTNWPFLPTLDAAKHSHFPSVQPPNPDGAGCIVGTNGMDHRLRP
jgi:hypothetical protein